jgi:hypothetical protein
VQLKYKIKDEVVPFCSRRHPSRATRSNVSIESESIEGEGTRRRQINLRKRAHPWRRHLSQASQGRGQSFEGEVTIEGESRSKASESESRSKASVESGSRSNPFEGICRSEYKQTQGRERNTISSATRLLWSRSGIEPEEDVQLNYKNNDEVVYLSAVESESRSKVSIESESRSTAINRRRRHAQVEGILRKSSRVSPGRKEFVEGESTHAGGNPGWKSWSKASVQVASESSWTVSVAGESRSKTNPSKAKSRSKENPPSKANPGRG